MHPPEWKPSDKRPWPWLSPASCWEQWYQWDRIQLQRVRGASWPQHPREAGQWAGSVFPARFAFDNWCFGIWKPDFCACVGRGKSTHIEGLLRWGYYLLLLTLIQPGRKLEHCVWSLSNQEFDLFVVFFEETLSALRWHNCLYTQVYPLAGPNQMQTITLKTTPYRTSGKRSLFPAPEWGNMGTPISNLTSKTH